MNREEEIISSLCNKLDELLKSENYDPDELYCILEKIEDKDEDDNDDWEDDEDVGEDDYCDFDLDDSGSDIKFDVSDCLYYLLNSYYPYDYNEFKRTGRDESYLYELKEKGVEFLIPFLKEIPESDVKEYLLGDFED